MRAFDLLSKAQQDLRNASHPRYHFEMVLLRWMHLRKLVPLEELFGQLGTGGASPSATSPRISAPSAPSAPSHRRTSAPSPPPAPSHPRTPAPSPPPAPSHPRTLAPSHPSPGSLKDALLAEIRAGKGFFYNTVVAQAQKIEVDEDRVTFTFLPAHRALREQFEQSRGWLETAAERLTGRRISVTAVQAVQDEAAASEAGPAAAQSAGAPAARDLKAEALSSTAVQALLDVFPAQIRDVEEM